MTTEPTQSRVTVSFTMSRTFEFDIDHDAIPDGTTVEDIAINRASETVRDRIIDAPMAYITVDHIELVDDE